MIALQATSVDALTLSLQVP